MSGDWLATKFIGDMKKKVIFLLFVPFFVGCGNNAQSPSSSDNDVRRDPIAKDVTPSTSNRSYSAPQKQRTIEKTFEVVADAYSVNETTMNMNPRGKYTLKVTLYSDHSAVAVGREDISMQIYKSTQDNWDFMCSVYGSGSYIYFFNTDEIYLLQ